MVHTTTEKTRNAGGGLLGNDGALVPILGGVAGGVATVYGAEKFGLSPVAAAGVGVAGGLGIRSAIKSPMMKNAMLGVAIGAGTLGGLHLVANARAHGATQPKPSTNTSHGKRQAEGNDGFVTQQQLNDALGKVADQHKETCDLMTALRAEIRRVVAGDDERPRTTDPVRSPGPTAGGVPHFYPLYPQRGASADDERNAFADDEYMRNAYSDDERNAYVSYDDERNAYVDDEYMRNAYSDDERNAYIDDERNADVEDERNAYVDDERNADVEDERNADGDSA